jgi:hypothetical protein
MVMHYETYYLHPIRMNNGGHADKFDLNLTRFLGKYTSLHYCGIEKFSSSQIRISCLG